MQRILLLLALFAPTAALYAQETQLVTPAELTAEDVEAVQFAKPSEEVLAKLEGRLELLVFTRKNYESCRGCEVAHNALKRLDDYPITQVFTDTVKGSGLSALYAVDETPTFVLVRRTGEGEGKELTRWVGARGVTDTTERIKREFYRRGYDAPKHSETRPPKREPRPIPTPEPRRLPPKKEPMIRPVPRHFWESFF